MSQYDRRYDGPPAGELRRYPTPPMPQDFHVNLPSPKGAVHPKQLYSLTRGKWDAKSYSPFVGRALRLWTREFAADHVIKRLKALLMIDDRTGVVWVEEQATKCQLSPEFSNPWCLLNWLEYVGLTRGWLMVHSWENRYKERGEEVTRRVFELRRI